MSRTESVNLRVRPSERLKLERVAAASGLSLSDVMRCLLSLTAETLQPSAEHTQLNSSRGAVEVEAQRAAVAP